MCELNLFLSETRPLMCVLVGISSHLLPLSLILTHIFSVGNVIKKKKNHKLHLQDG